MVRVSLAPEGSGSDPILRAPQSQSQSACSCEGECVGRIGCEVVGLALSPALGVPGLPSRMCCVQLSPPETTCPSHASRKHNVDDLNFAIAAGSCPNPRPPTHPNPAPERSVCSLGCLSVRLSMSSALRNILRFS
jgi:hypothetical protein